MKGLLTISIALCIIQTVQTQGGDYNYASTISPDYYSIFGEGARVTDTCREEIAKSTYTHYYVFNHSGWECPYDVNWRGGHDHTWCNFPTIGIRHNIDTVGCSEADTIIEIYSLELLDWTTEIDSAMFFRFVTWLDSLKAWVENR